MNQKKIKMIRGTWGDKECDHPFFDVEVVNGVVGNSFQEMKTGDYVCTQCGRIFTRAEKANIEKNRS